MRLSTALLLLSAVLSAQSKSPAHFDISWPKPLDGRLLLILSTTGTPEPRQAVSEGLGTQQMSRRRRRVGPQRRDRWLHPGLSRASVSTEIPAGEYYVQAVLNVYETFHRADGRTLKLPMDQGEGQHWNRKPGNLYSEPRRSTVDPGFGSDRREVELTKTIPPIEPPKDTKYIKHVRIQSKLLSEFWGRPMYLGAVVLLPEGFDEHPNARYPVLYCQGHFRPTFTRLPHRAAPPAGARWRWGPRRWRHRLRLQALPGLDQRAGCRAC